MWPLGVASDFGRYLRTVILISRYPDAIELPTKSGR
jgi:hypothetical protein